MGSGEDEKADQWGEEEDDIDQEEEEKKKKKKKKGMCAKLLKFFASLGGGYQTDKVATTITILKCFLGGDLHSLIIITKEVLTVLKSLTV